MSLNLRIGVLLVALFLLIIVIHVLKKGKIPIKYSLLWFISILILFLVSLVPNTLMLIADIFGFEVMSNMIIGVFLVILLFISISLTIIISDQRQKIILLIQEISLLKEKNNDK